MGCEEARMLQASRGNGGRGGVQVNTVGDRWT